MKKLKQISVAIILAIMLPILMLGCGQNAAAPNSPDDRLKIVATIFPPYDFSRQISGDKADVTLLLPPGTESHSFEPSPKDIIAIQECDVFIYTGGESDSWIDGILESMDTHDITIISMMNLVDVKQEEVVEGMEPEGDGQPKDGHGQEDGYDEHVWTSPKNAVKIVTAISETLCSLDEANANTYQKNTEAYTEQLNELDSQFREITDNGKRNTLVFGDRFPFRYLADEYGLQYYAAFPGCSTQTEPSAATVAFLIDKVKQEDIPVVFHIESSSQQMADTICAETGAKKLLLHSCHNLTKEEMASGAGYLSLMKQNAVSLKEALQ